jgi:hypothetical protein
MAVSSRNLEDRLDSVEAALAHAVSPSSPLRARDAWLLDLAEEANLDLSSLFKLALGYPEATDSESLAMLHARVVKARNAMGCSQCSSQKCKSKKDDRQPPIRQLP